MYSFEYLRFICVRIPFNEPLNYTQNAILSLVLQHYIIHFARLREDSVNMIDIYHVESPKKISPKKEFQIMPFFRRGTRKKLNLGAQLYKLSG